MHGNHVVASRGLNLRAVSLVREIFSELKIRKPDYNLKIKMGQFGVEIADIISKTEKIIVKEKPDILLILGIA